MDLSTVIDHKLNKSVKTAINRYALKRKYDTSITLTDLINLPIYNREKIDLWSAKTYQNPLRSEKALMSREYCAAWVLAEYGLGFDGGPNLTIVAVKCSGCFNGKICFLTCDGNNVDCLTGEHDCIYCYQGLIEIIVPEVRNYATAPCL